MSRINNGLLLFIMVILVVACSENKNPRFDKTRYLTSCGLSIDQMLLTDEQEDSLTRLVFDMERSSILHFRNELINDANTKSCKALLIKYGERLKHGYNDSLLFAHYYALGISIAKSPREIINLTLAYAQGQSSDVKQRIGENSFPYAKSISDTLAFLSSSIIISGISGGDYASFLGWGKDAIPDSTAKKLLKWSNIGINYAISGNGIDSRQYCTLLEHLTFCSWKLNDPHFGEYADSLINYKLARETLRPLLGEGFKGAIYDRYRFLVNKKDYHKAEQILDYYCPSIDLPNHQYSPLTDIISDRKRQDYHEPVDITSPFISSLNRNTIWLIETALNQNPGQDISNSTLLYFEKARLKYIQGDENYSQWLNLAYFSGVNSIFPATAHSYISNYLRAGFQYNDGVISLLTLQYNNADSRSVYDALLFVKNASESVPVNIYSYAKSHSPADIQSYIDSLRRYGLKGRETVGGGHKQDYLENEIGPYVKDILFKSITSFTEIQGKLKEDAISVEFYAAPSLSFNGDYFYGAAILTAGCKEPTIVDICPSERIKKILFSRDLYKTTEAYYTLWAPIDRFLDGKKTVYYSTDRLLNICNIQAILTPNNRRLSQEYELIQLSSTKEITDNPAPHQYQSIALFGGIEYGSDLKILPNRQNSLSAQNSTRAILLRSFHRGDFSPLPYSKVEIDDISTCANENGIKVQCFSSSDGTEEAFKELSGKKISILHIATHGFYYSEGQSKGIDYLSIINNKANPLDRCGLLLAGSLNTWHEPQQVPDKEDGILLGEEIAKLDFTNVDLVVLSACNSALGDINSEGVTGLRQAFKRSGAKSILITLSNIDDKATSFFMSAFYEKLFESGDRHIAYDFAVNKMKSTKDYSDPHYWSSFVLID